MDNFKVALAIGGIVLFVVAINLIKSALSKGIGKLFDVGVKVVNRKRDAQVDRVMTTPAPLETRATVAQVREAITAALSPKPSLPFVGAGLIETSHAGNKLSYAMGNRFFPREVLAEVEITDQGEMRRVVFTCTRLAEHNGIRQLADSLLLMEQTFVHAVGAAGDPVKVAAVARAYGPPDPGTPLADQMAMAKGIIVAGAVVSAVVVVQLGMGILVSDVPFWLAVLACGAGSSWLGSRMFAGARDRHIESVLGSPRMSAAGSAGSPHAVVSSEAATAAAPAATATAAPSAAPTAPGSTPAGNRAARWVASLDGRAKALLAVAVALLVLGIGLSATRAREASISSEDSDAVVMESASDYVTDGTGDGSDPGAQTASEADSAPEMGSLSELLSQAPSDGSVITRRAFWDAENSISNQRIAFTTDDPANEGRTYVIDAEELTSCYVGNESVPAGDLIVQAFGMYHAGTITYSKDGLVDVRAITFKASEIDSDVRDALTEAARKADHYEGDYSIVDLKMSDEWALGALQQNGGQEYLNYYAWHKSGGAWSCQTVGAPTSDYKEASMECAAKAGVPQELISALQWQFKPSWQEGE